MSVPTRDLQPGDRVLARPMTEREFRGGVLIGRLFSTAETPSGAGRVLGDVRLDGDDGPTHCCLVRHEPAPVKGKRQ